MKRSPSALVQYSSSEDDEELPKIHVPKKRKLPALASSLIIPSPIDNPSLHQGRKRSTPHAEGQYAAYVYVSLRLEPDSPLYRLIDEIVTETKKSVPSSHAIDAMHSAGTPEATENHCKTEFREFHISLSRPILLRAHQREDLKRATKKIAMHQSPFTASFTSVTELINDERTRTFLALEVGAGHQEFVSMSETLTPTLRAIRQKEFYPRPRFHASIAWALLDPVATCPKEDGANARGAVRSASVASLSSRSSLTPAHPTGSPALSDKKLFDSATQVDAPCTISEEGTRFPTIPHIPPELITRLNAKYRLRLSSRHVGSIEVDEICVKIGKDVSKWRLGHSKTGCCRDCM